MWISLVRYCHARHRLAAARRLAEPCIQFLNGAEDSTTCLVPGAGWGSHRPGVGAQAVVCRTRKWEDSSEAVEVKIAKASGPLQIDELVVAGRSRSLLGPGRGGWGCDPRGFPVDLEGEDHRSYLDSVSRMGDLLADPSSVQEGPVSRPEVSDLQGPVLQTQLAVPPGYGVEGDPEVTVASATDHGHVAGQGKGLLIPVLAHQYQVHNHQSVPLHHRPI